MTAFIEANRLTSGIWGIGTWRGNNPGDYSGFYFPTTLTTGDIYLDADNNGSFDSSKDNLIGYYQNQSIGSTSASSGTWTRFNGANNGSATGLGVNSTFSITAPMRFSTSNASEITGNWYEGIIPVKGTLNVHNIYNLVQNNYWSAAVKIISIGQASNKGGERIDATQIEFGQGTQGSVLNGGVGNDTLWGRAGWDIIDGGEGDDLIRGGNGRDIITGGLGRDELHGDFGWNTFKSEKDGFTDLIVVKSDQWLSNWLLGGAGNNADGSKCDIIEGLDTIDKIKILGVSTQDLTFQNNVTAQGTTGIGIFAKGALEALYTGGDLSVDQLRRMTTGDANLSALEATGFYASLSSTTPNQQIAPPQNDQPSTTNQTTGSARFKSDYVYSGRTEVDAITKYVTQFGSNPQLEFEYNDKYFVVTNTFNDEVRRTVYIGSFDITDDGIIKRATVSEERIGSEFNGPYSTRIFPYAPFTIENVDGLVRFWAASVTARRATGEQFVYGDPEDPINKKFFQTDWWKNPFESNLI